jgi:hypothetical protein
VSEADLDKTTQRIEIPGGSATVVDLSGTDPHTSKPSRMVVVMVLQRDNTWFYKMLGDPATVGSEKDNLLNFVRTVFYP